ncbi:diguanylate cyclase DgcA [Treponema phagedenis]|uniref:diguanylate cyclase DgcA n=1 Tax=Treponema phagedenis TaxID=162 RepID=UPI0001F64200|nr:diguanylate cyclase DgcA [Treponema phagedenis]EFW39324.1 diguanylate cyclase (GGDEF) domain protein [Treponema phagedenis F0421]
MDEKMNEQNKLMQYNEKFEPEDLSFEKVPQEKQIYDLKQLLEISKSLNSMMEFDRLVEAILYTSMAQMKTLGAALFTKKTFDSDGFILNRNYYGFETDPDRTYSIEKNHAILELLDEENYCLTPAQLKQLIPHDEILETLLALHPSLFIPFKAKNRLVGFLLLGEQINAGEDYTPYEKEFIMSIASLAAIAINNALLLERSTTDMMTHLKLKHYFYTVLNEKADTLPDDTPLSILMLDIDFFKKINDTYGHACGDLVLQQVAKIIQSCTRTGDMAARYGGEEFIVMLYNTNSKEAQKIAERIRTLIQDLSIQYNEFEVRVTISIGVATFLQKMESLKNLLERADIALYQSKENGRNRVSISAENLP